MTKKREGKLCASVLALTMLASGCGAAPAETLSVSSAPVPVTTASEEEMEFALPYSVAGGLHPITGTNRVNLTLTPLLYRGLFQLENFTAQPDLCQSYEVSQDGLTWTFTLKKTTFSDGSPLTAAAVVASLNQARQAGRFSARLEAVKRVEAQGETVVVTLSRPNGKLPVLLDVPIVKAADDPTLPLGTGPYYLTTEDTTGKSEWVLAARQGAETPLERIPLRAVGAGDDLISAFGAGEISLVDTDLTGTNALGYSGRFESTDYPTTTLLYVGTNLGNRNSLCREPAVRRAVSWCVDREKMVSRLLAGHAVATDLLIHPDALQLDSPESGSFGGYDLEQAAAALEGDGWSRDSEGEWSKRGTRLALRFLVNQDNSSKIAVAETLRAGLEALGCDVTLEKLPWDEFSAALKKGNFDLYLGEVVMTADFDPTPLVGSNGTLNYGKCGDRNLDAALNTWRAGNDKDAAEALYVAIAEAAPVIPICFKNGSVLSRWGRLSGLKPTQRNIFAHMEQWSIRGQS